MAAPALVVTIDCEEEGLWSGSYRTTGNRCRNIEQLPYVHEIFARLGVVPTYLVDHPVATDGAAVRVLRELTRGGAGELGAHLHPWCTPPLQEGGDSPRASYTHQLAPELQERKLDALCCAIADAFGARPRSYRAGRWGFDHTSVPVLERLGFTVDTSVDPLWWDPEPGGPDFVRAPLAPYRLSREDVCRPGAGPLVEVPVSTAFTGRLARALERLARRVAPLPGLRRWLVRAGLVSLKPELHPLPRMLALADELAAREHPIFNVMFHSSTVLPGATPYVGDARARGEFLARLEGLLAHLVRRHRAVPMGLAQVPSRLSIAAPNSATKRPAAAASE
jgi:hypothetical protein